MKLLQHYRYSNTNYWGEHIYILPSLSFKWEKVNIAEPYKDGYDGAMLEINFDFIHKSFVFVWVFEYNNKQTNMK